MPLRSLTAWFLGFAVVLSASESWSGEIEERFPLGILGAQEEVVIEPGGLRFLARIDTGAETSSIDAREIEVLERDGVECVRFLVPPRPLSEDAIDDEDAGDLAEAITITLPVARWVRIARSDHPDERRAVVELGLRIGALELEREFTLNDRRDLTNGVLIGRNVLAGMALVDAGRERLIETPRSATAGP